MLLFGGGTALLSWLLEVFGAHGLGHGEALAWLAASAALMGGYVWHSRHHAAPLLNLALLKVRTFRVSVLGGMFTRLGIGGTPLLLPLLYQVGLGMPAWQSGLLMMPAAAAAMVMKTLAQRVLGRFGYRRVLMVNTWIVAVCIAAFSQVGLATPIPVIVGLGLVMGLANSLQFTSLNTIAFADLGERDTADGSTIASTFQQLSLSFGLASGTLAAGYFLAQAPSGVEGGALPALHKAFLLLAAFTLAASTMFRTLRDRDGDNVSRPGRADAEEASASFRPT